MNTRNIKSKIKYEHLEYMRNMITYDFKCEIRKYKDLDLYNDIDFIEYFKDRDQHFWCDIIFYSSFSIEFLFKNFLNHVLNIKVYNEFLLRLEQMNKHKCYEWEGYEKLYKRMNEYFYEYENYLNKFRN